MSTHIEIDHMTTFVTNQLSRTWYEEHDTSELYNFVCRQFPDNRWKEMILEYVTERDGDLYVSINTLS